MIVRISPRAKKYGYIIWPKALDIQMRALLGDVLTKIVVFDGTELGTKKIDWNRRRISVGPSRTRSLAEGTMDFVLSAIDEKLHVTCR